MGGKVNNRELLVKIFDIIIKSKVCPKTSYRQWSATLQELHRKGMLYCAIDRTTEKVLSAWAVYRIPSWHEMYRELIPITEKGEIIYVPFFVSIDPKQNGPLTALKSYLAEHPEVKELIYYRRNSDTDFRRIKFKFREGNHVEQKSASLNNPSA